MRKDDNNEWSSKAHLKAWSSAVNWFIKRNLHEYWQRNRLAYMDLHNTFNSSFKISFPIFFPIKFILLLCYCVLSCLPVLQQTSELLLIMKFQLMFLGTIWKVCMPKSPYFDQSTLKYLWVPFDLPTTTSPCTSV